MENLYYKSRKNNSKYKERSLRVEAAKNYDGRFPFYSLPVEIGNYSINFEDEFCNDSHQMKYLSMPNRLTHLHIDLNEGYSEYVPEDRTGVKDFMNSRYVRILKWISCHEEDIKKQFTNRPNENIDFICYRGVLTAIASTVYEEEEDWMFYATKFRSIIYIRNVDTEQKIERESSMTEKQKLMTSWGRKFEQCITSGTMNMAPNTSVPVNEREKFFVMMKGKIENYQLLFGAEVDAIDPQYCTGSDPGNDEESIFRYVELKTTKYPNNDRLWLFFRRYKLLKWYLQNFLCGIPRVLCGFRDDTGIVRELRMFNVSDMPEMAEGLWSPAACLNFVYRFLSYVKHCVVKDDPRTVYKFYCKPGVEITCEELSPEHQFLPEWYINGTVI